MRRALPCLALALLATSAHAGGVNLRWTRCYGDGGVSNRSFACNANFGTNLTVGSFVLDSPLSQVSANEFWIDIQTAAPALPAWWQFKNTGSCRATSLAMNTSANPADIVCADWAQGASSSGIGAYTVGTLGPNTAQIHGVLAVPPASYMDLVSGQEYFSFNININNQKTVGTSACTGCAVPACLALSTFKVYFDGSANTIQTLTTPAYGTNSNYVSWQGGDGIVPFPNGTCAGFDTAGFAVNTSVVGRGTVLRSRTKTMYPPGSPISLYAQPSAGDRFIGWSGDTTSTEDTLNIVVTRPLSYTATFDRDPADAAALTGVGDEPADQGGFVRLHWTPSPLDDPAFPGLLCCYEVQRRPSAAPGDPWTTVGETPVSDSPSYELLVPTPADSSAAGPALFRFRVVAKAASEPAEWDSNELDGHSVDNLPPPPPASVSGSISSGIATFFWPAVSVPDLDHYAVYRGVEDAPPTDAAHRIGTTTNTGYNDSPGYFAHYLVSAVDVHGNEGSATAFVPVNSAGVDDRPAPGVLTVGSPTPSPMSGSMSMSLGLPRDMNVSVDVVDAQGRLLRRLRDGVTPAGWLTVSWDARDARCQRARAGIYFVRVRTPAGERIRRLAVLP
jgi:hypothetical protein